MPKTREVTLSIPGWLSVTLEPNEAEQAAAWSLYVELSTRIATQPFSTQTGNLRAALNSLYSLFDFTRQVLHEAGPRVAHRPEAFGPIAIRFLTEILAPFLTRWHEPLATYELSRPEGVGQLAYERSWVEYNDMANQLEDLQNKISLYVEALESNADIRVTSH